MKSKIFHSIKGNQWSKVVSCLINAGVVDYLQVPLLQTLVPMTTTNQQYDLNNNSHQQPSLQWCKPIKS